MSLGAVEKLADAVMYEGYLLYPYRASAIKNQQRFNFGVLYPRAYCELQSGAEAFEMKTECLVTGSPSTRIESKLRFLQMIENQSRQEGCERDAVLPSRTLESILTAGVEQTIRYDSLEAKLNLSAIEAGQNLFRISLDVRNCATLAAANQMSRNSVLLQSLVSVHSILKVTGGEFVSALDPPEHLKDAAAACRNIGTWPVLVGEPGQRDMMLSAPIILYDYPQIAPESPGDLFDGTEIDEILALRILTMTDEEKREVRSGDGRARKILERTELMPPEHFQKLHGALRGLQPGPGESR